MSYIDPAGPRLAQLDAAYQLSSHFLKPRRDATFHQHVEEEVQRSARVNSRHLGIQLLQFYDKSVSSREDKYVSFRRLQDMGRRSRRQTSLASYSNARPT